MALSTSVPGVFIQEVSNFPGPIYQVETAIPAFIGYTEKDSAGGSTLVNKPKRISSLPEFEQLFGMPEASAVIVEIDNVNGVNKLTGDVVIADAKFKLHYSLQLFFENGGGSCFINSVGSYSAVAATSIDKYNQLKAGLDAVKELDEPTILLFPDAGLLEKEEFYQLYRDGLKQCAELRDRIVIVDVYTKTGTEAFASLSNDFYNGVGESFLSYGAAYYPYLKTTITLHIDEALITVEGGTLPANSFLKLSNSNGDFSKSIYHTNPILYADVIDSIKKNHVVMPPASAVAGAYCTVDNNRGVWRAPANISLNDVIAPMVTITDNEQADMNVTLSGKSVNAIRTFTGKGTLIWGARTLAGNDNDWRYISVRRFFNMIEESVKKGTEWVVFEENNASSWIKVKSMVENFLTLQWKAGALPGVKPEEAFFVNVGIGKTMTAQDILEGRMIVEIGMSVVRPAEFILLCFSHKMMNA